jgi:hypothetical protein
MIYKNVLTFIIITIFSGILNTTAIFAHEIEKIPLSQNEIVALQQLGGEQIQNIVQGKSSNEDVNKDVFANLTDDERNTLLSLTPAQIDQIIAGEASGSDLLLTTFAVVGIIALIYAASYGSYY